MLQVVETRLLVLEIFQEDLLVQILEGEVVLLGIHLDDHVLQRVEVPVVEILQVVVLSNLVVAA